jgi:hypothetical protein
MMRPAIPLTALAAAIPALVAPTGAVAQQPLQPPPPSDLPGLRYTVPFFPDAQHDPAVPTPDSILGFPVGERPARHAQIEACLKAWAASPRARLVEYARSHENRALYYLVVSSEANIARLDDLRRDLARLADPRSTPPDQAARLADTLPAVAWMAYTIHGDEMSGSDAALALAHHLLASQAPADRALLDDLVVIIDPLMNPDGRERFLDLLAQNRTAQPSVDDQSVLHSRPWPAGRTNHYLFDLNRDWLFAVHPESRGRIAALRDWSPHFLADAHEMSSRDTYLFSPPREPINANIPANVRRWWETFSKDQAAALDAFGWRYFTGEWNEELYPGYTTTLAALRGAISMLYEQASVAIDAVRRPEGTLEAYREGVHRQLVSSLANLATLRANRRLVLADYAAVRRQAVAGDGPSAGGARRTFAVVPSANRSRLAAFLDLMTLHGVEVYAAPAEFQAPAATDRLGRRHEGRIFPPGTLLVPDRQPEARLAAAILELDPRLSDAVLTDERRELLRFGRSRMYDVTGWSLLHLFDLDAWELAMPMPADAARIQSLPPAPAPPPARPQTPPVAWALDGADDRAVAVAGRLMERGVRVRASDKPSELAGRAFPRGSFFITRIDNRDAPGDLAATVSAAAAELELVAWPIASGLGPGDLPDLGGEHFPLLHRPRIAVLSRAPVSTYAFGEIWHLIDHVLGLRASYIDAQELADADLRRYNVVVLPPGAGGLIRDRQDALRAWVRAGGTLVAIGSSAAAVAAPDLNLCAARTLPDVLTRLDDYTVSFVREWEGQHGAADSASAWSYSPPARVAYPWVPDKSPPRPSDEELRRRDAWRRIFMPQGAILAGRADDRAWLTAGCADTVAVMYTADAVLMAADPVQAPVRLGAIVPATVAAADAAKPDSKPDPVERHWAFLPPGAELRLRMGGLLWPEAADRLAGSAYLTRERVGHGQVILFASGPTFRGAARGTARLFANAIVCGPGMGASQPVKP